MSVSMANKSEHPSTTLGFWLYLMTDMMLFATLFAAFMVLRRNTAGGPSGPELFDMNLVLAETLILLMSSLFCGLAWLAFRHKRKADFIAYFAATLVAGAVFLGLELNEFAVLINEGYTWQTSAFLSSFFTLVGTHGLHIAFGLIWGVVLAVAIAKRGMTPAMLRKFGLFSLFWHFLDLVWIFVFTVVYVIGGAA